MKKLVLENGITIEYKYGLYILENTQHDWDLPKFHRGGVSLVRIGLNNFCNVFK